MTPTARPDRGANGRRALVFGGGGVLGFAWTVGALRALEIEWGVDANAVALNVGTSAGSMVAALLGCRIEADVIRRHHQGVPIPADPNIKWDYRSDSGGALPPWPGFVPGSPRLLFDAVRHPMSMPAGVALSGLLPRGRGTLEPIRSVISAAMAAAAVPGAGDDTDTARGSAALIAAERSAPRPGGAHWPNRPQTWIVATDYDSGARMVFGRDQPATGPVDLGDAVAASCAIPAWYSPVPIGNRSYIDGGTASNASADLVEPLVADGSIDEVFILAPMASVEPDRPRSPMVRLERAVRRVVTRGIQHDAARLRAAGAQVVVLTPGPYDLDVMGGNLMNPRRRTEVLDTALLTSTAALRELRLTIGAARVQPGGRV
jgi:NTE family protein